MRKLGPIQAWAGGGYLHVPCHVDEDDDGNFIGANCPDCRDFMNGPGWPGTVHRLRPKWRIGDRLWVREGHCVRNDGHGADYLVRYLADGVEHWVTDASGCWMGMPDSRKRSPIHMPRWASRLTLLVTDVRAQRLQDISEEDALEEGLAPSPGGWWSGAEGQAGTTPKAAFALLWNSIHGPGAWDENLWVAAISFDVIRANIDARDGAPPPSPVAADTEMA